MRPAATALATLAMALGAVALAFADPSGDGVDARLAAATGAVHISNSLEGRAVFGAEALRPGDSATGDVRIGNDGSVRAVVTLSATRVQETGAAASLSDALQLSVVDVTGDLSLYSGPAASFQTVGVGSLAAGGSRVVRFTATLPRSAGNALQGASTTLGLQWNAVVAGVAAPPSAPTPAPTPTATPTPAPTGTPATPATPKTPTGAALADAIGMPHAGTRVRKGRMLLRVHALDGAKVLAAAIAVNGKVKKRVKGTRSIVKVNLLKLRGRTVKIAVTIRASDGRRYTARRSYRTLR